MSRHTHLWKRGSTYYFRIRVPSDLVDVLGKQELKRSLKTSDLQKAKERVRLEAVAADALFAKTRRMMAAEMQRELPEHELRRLAHIWYQEAKSSLNEESQDSLVLPPELVVTSLSELEGTEAALRAKLGHNDLVYAKQQVSELLEAQEVKLVESSLSYQKLRQYIVRGMVVLAQLARGQLKGDFEFKPQDPLFEHVSDSEEMLRSKFISLSELIEHYENEPSRSSLAGKTQVGYKVIFRVLRELLGADKPVCQINREDCRKVRDALMVLPPRASQRFPGVPVARVIELARERGDEAISPTTANSYLNNLSSLFNWAVQEEYMTRNPAVGLRVSAPKVNARDKWLPFTTEQLKAIFNAPLYTGCKDDRHGYAAKGPNVPRRGRFWVPLLALFSGMRLNECCQLDVADIVKIDGVDCIRVVSDEEAGKRVKTIASHRVVPIHPELVKVGFLRYVLQQRQRGEVRLFPDLPRGKGGYYSDPFSKWFIRFLKSTGAASSRTSFHSFRHCFKDALEEAGVSIKRINALGGWDNREGTSSVYGSGYRASTLLKEIGKLEYPGLDLSHLKMSETVR